MKKVCFSIVLALLSCPLLHPYSRWQQIESSPFPINTNQAFRNGPRQLMYSPNGDFLAVANHGGFPGQNGSVSVFAVNQTTDALKEIKNSPFSTLQHQTISLSFSPKGTPSSLSTASLVQSGIGTTIFDFNSTTGVLSNNRPPTGCTGVQASITYSPDGLFVAAGGFNVSLFSVGQSGSGSGNLTCFATTPITGIPVRAVAYRPLTAGAFSDPYYVASISPTPSLIQLFSIDKITGLPIDSPIFPLPDNSGPHWIEFSPNGNFLAIAMNGGITIKEFSITNIGTPVLLPLNAPTSFFPTPTSQTGGRAAQVRSVAYSPNGKWLATANGNSTISIFTVNKNTGVLFNRQDFTVGHTGNFGTSDRAFSVDFAPDSCSLAICNRDDNSISVFKIVSTDCIVCQLSGNKANLLTHN